MKKGSWKRKIIEQMEAANTYQDSLLPLVETLAEILARRDEAVKQWREEGALYMTTFTSDRGATNQKKNPLLGVIQEHERDALSYWGSLGLTHQALKRALGEVKDEKPLSPLVKALMQAENDKKS